MRATQVIARLISSIRGLVDSGAHLNKERKNTMKVAQNFLEDKIDLSKATLFADSNRGVYIPQCFAETVKREYVTGVSDENYKVLEAGPEHTEYWGAWADVLYNAKINDPVHGECYLHPDGDLWVVPVEKEPEGKQVLGHNFVPFTDSDWQGWAGAEEGSLICHSDGAVLILSPDGTIEEDVINKDGKLSAFIWKKEQIV